MFQQNTVNRYYTYHNNLLTGKNFTSSKKILLELTHLWSELGKNPILTRMAF